MQSLLDAIYSGNAILFVGSGFSSEAEGLSKMKMPTGGEFSKLLQDKLSLPREYPLDVLAREYKQRFGENKLFDLMNDLFTATEISFNQRAISAVPWKRVYTTNYDDVVEKCLESAGVDFQPRNAMIEDPKSFKKTAVVHLNGRMLGTQFKDFDRTIRLTRASYLSDQFVSSNWYNTFSTDIAISSCVVFIGYSVYDIDVGRILYSDPTLKAKTFFIEVSDIDPVFERELSIYGDVLPIGISEFSQSITSHKSLPYATQPIHGFDRLEINSSTKAATGDDVLELLLFGSYSPAIDTASTISGTPYTIDREFHAEVYRQIEKGVRRHLIHGDLGSGKSISLLKIGKFLATNGYASFQMNDNDETMPNDLFLIKKDFARPVILVEDIFRNAKRVSIITRDMPDCIVIATTRSAVYELNSHRIQEIFGGDFIEYDCNKLTLIDIEGLIKIIDDNGLWSDFSNKSDREKRNLVSATYRSEMRNVLIGLIESPHIKERIIRAFDETIDRDALKAICATLILHIAEFPSSLNLIKSLVDVDLYAKRTAINNSFSMEFISEKYGNIKVKSSILAEYVVQNVLSPGYVSRTLIEILRACDGNGRDEDIYRSIQKYFIRFSFIDKLFLRRKVDNIYKEIYDAIKSLPSMARNPQFWLQYAIARLEDKNFRASEIHFSTAYSHAKAIKSYDTFQIDNHFARFLLQSRTEDPTYLDSFRAFLDAHRLLTNQAKKEKDAYYPYKVARNYASLYAARSDSFDDGQLKVVAGCCREILNEQRKISTRAQKYYVIEECRRDLEGLIEAIEARLR